MLCKVEGRVVPLVECCARLRVGWYLLWSAVCLPFRPAGGAVEDATVITNALDEDRPQLASRPCSGRVTGLRAVLQRGVSADEQRKRPHPLKDKEEGILRQSRCAEHH